jgi:hypothetical protein
MSETDTLRRVLEASNVTSVIWIDDRFEPSAPGLADAAEWLGTIHFAKARPQHSALSKLNVTDDLSLWTGTLSELQIASPNIYEEVARSLAEQAAGLVGAETGTATSAEYSTGEIDAIKASFGEIKCIGHTAWQKDKLTLLQGMSRKSLVIIDREFVVDGKALRLGDGILRELVVAPGCEAHLVMLTHSVAPGDVAALRRELAGDDATALHRFAVVAKGGSGDAAERLRESIRVVMTHGTCFALLQTIAKEMKRGVERALSELMDESVYDLDVVVFGKSLEEGASEIDVLTRLVLLRQRIEVESHLARDEQCHAKVDALRKLRSLSGTLAPTPSTSKFEVLRTHEIFDSGELINQRHSPLACGDFFSVDGQTNKLWVLLGQPCDISVRATGKRKFEQAVLVLAKPVEGAPVTAVGRALAEARSALEAANSPKALAVLAAMSGALEKLGDAPASHRFFPLNARLNDRAWQLDFLNWTPVSLECLDLCVFNPDGALKLDPNAARPTALLPGWQKRFDAAAAEIKKAAGQVPKEWVLGGSNISHRTPKIQNGVLTFKYKRVGRIRAPRSVAAYAAFSSYQSRAAFDHDFSDMLHRADEGSSTKGTT